MKLQQDISKRVEEKVCLKLHVIIRVQGPHLD